jgi:hypothetical protein
MIKSVGIDIYANMFFTAREFTIIIIIISAIIYVHIIVSAF